MNSKLKTLTLLSVGIATSLGCGNGPDKDDEPQPVSSITARQAITSNTKGLAAKISTTIKFLDGSELFQRGADFAGPSSISECGTLVDPNNPDADPIGCGEPQPADPSLDLDLNDEADALTQELELKVFANANIEADTEFAVTYLIRGEVFCAEDGAPADPGCVADVDAAEIRLVVTSPASGDVDVDVLVGPNRANPLSLQIHEALLAAEIDLGGIADSADHLGAIVGETPELPPTFEGRVRLELSAPAADQVGAAISVLQAIKIAGGDFSLSVGQSLPLYSLTVDSTAKTVVGEADAGAIDGDFPITSLAYDSATGVETETSYDLGFHLGGSTSTMLFDVASEVLTFSGLLLGPDPATVSINGDEVVAIDLNPDAGRAIELTVTEDAGGVKVEVSPLFDLRVALQFAAALDALDDVDDWMLDEVMGIRLDGAAKPAVRFTDDGLEVLDGTLTLSMQNAGISHTVGVGQCLLDTYEITPTAPVGPGTDTDPEPLPVDESSNPFEEVVVSSCQ